MVFGKSLSADVCDSNETTGIYVHGNCSNTININIYTCVQYVDNDDDYGRRHDCTDRPMIYTDKIIKKKKNLIKQSYSVETETRVDRMRQIRVCTL